MRASAVDSENHSEVPDITPFWQRLPLFFRYPLHAEPLLYMMLLAATTLLGFVLPIPSPLDHLLVHFGVWLAFIRYSYKTLDQTAQGLLTPDQHQSYDDPERKSLPYKQFVIFIVVAFALGYAARIGNLVFWAMAIFSILALPASVMILSITRSFWSGLNPVAAISMMRAIGLPYLGLCAFLFLLSASEQMLQMSLVSRLPGWLLLPALNLVAMFFTLIMFNMMGYVVFQFHHLLGLDISSAASVDGGMPGAKANDSPDAIGRLIGAGQIDEALDLAYEAQRVAPEDVAAHGRYHKLLALAGRDDRLMKPCCCIARCRNAMLLMNQSSRGSFWDWRRPHVDAANSPRHWRCLRASTSVSHGMRRFRPCICLPRACCARTCAKMPPRARS